MTLSLLVASSIAVAALAVAVLLYIDRGVLRRELATALGNERLAAERLVNARKDGYEIPSPEAVAAAATPQAPVLSRNLQELVDDWDSPIARDAQRREIRRLIDQGMSEPEVFRRLAPAEAQLA